MNKIKYILGSSYSFLLLGATSVFAQEEPIVKPKAPFESGRGLISTLERIINWIAIIVIVVSVLYIILAAYDYLTAGGDEDKIKTANRRLTYAILAIVLALVAEGIVRAIMSIVMGRQLIP